MHLRHRLSSPTAVMNEAFRRSFPPQHDLPPAMSVLLAKLAALEATSATCVMVSTLERAPSKPQREPQMA